MGAFEKIDSRMANVLELKEKVIDKYGDSVFEQDSNITEVIENAEELVTRVQNRFILIGEMTSYEDVIDKNDFHNEINRINSEIDELIEIYNSLLEDTK